MNLNALLDMQADSTVFHSSGLRICESSLRFRQYDVTINAKLWMRTITTAASVNWSRYCLAKIGNFIIAIGYCCGPCAIDVSALPK